MGQTYSKKVEPSAERWDDFRYFVAVANSASIKKAAQALGTTQSVVTRHIVRLEQSLGAKLFDRGSAGTQLTYQGERILPRILSAQSELSRARIDAQHAESRIEGDCSILLGDGIAIHWIAQFLPLFFQTYPNIELKMILDHDLSAPRNEIFDIRLHYFDPAHSDQIAKSLATVHFVPFASKRYLERNGKPEKKEDLIAHRAIDLSQYLSTAGSWTAWFDGDTGRSTSLFTNQSSFLAQCVAQHVGVALMPTYMVLKNAEIEPLDIGLRFTNKLFATYHRDRSLKQSVRTTLTFLRNVVFNTKKMPWFSEVFSLPQPEWHEAYRRGVVNEIPL